ncbi:MAG: stage II sporulation protein E, partial [Bacteroidota bacterium]|nr:stage II sporulation protein E [Bacteroidota bacterium]
TISATKLAQKVVTQAERNDIGKLKDDASCAIIYFREPRKLLICSGPPFDETKDHLLAEHVSGFKGRTVISGGTTAQIISRELNRPIEVDMNALNSNLPPASKMSGIDLVTEGVLTIGAVAERLENNEDIRKLEKDAATEIVKMLLSSDEIHFLIGTRVNNAHQDPSLPVELEIRRNVIKKIAWLLEERYLKEVYLQFI